MISKSQMARGAAYGALSLSALTLAVSAQAQGGLEEIVVTAQKRSESMQEVPISVSALSGEFIADQNITNISGLYNTMPNVQINQFSNSPDSAVFTIRGVGVNDADPYVGTTVSVIVDGVPVGVNTAALTTLFDIDRIEVLRGPQGTLFGANTTGGAINVVTKKPTGEYGGEAQVTVGNHGRTDANLAVNFPINDQWAGKVSLLHTSHDGFFKNTVDGSDLGERNVTSLRGYLQYTADDYDATLIAEYVRSRNGSQTVVPTSDSTQLFFVPGLTPDEPRHSRGHSNGLPDQNDKDSYSLTLTQNFYNTGVGDMVSITSYREYDQDLYSDDDGLPPQLLHTRRQTDHKQFSQELRTSMNLSEKVELLVGGFGFYQEYQLQQDGVLDGFLPGLGQPQFQDQENWSGSLFSQIYVDLTDKLRLQAGLRYSHEETEALSTTANTLAPGGGQASFNDPIIPGSFVEATGDESWDEIGGKIGLDYFVNPDVMLYGYYARGFKSGGFVGRIIVAEDIGPFDPEYVDTFEVGIKGEFLDNRLRLNAAAFYNLYDDMQVVQNITLPTGQNSSRIENAGEATTQGVEFEATALPTDNLKVSLSLAYLDATYDEYETQVSDGLGGLEPADFSGNQLMNAPRWTGNANVDYTVPVGAGNATFFAQVTYTDEKVSNFTNFPQEQIDDLTLVNARMSWTPDNERWSVGVYGRNLTDEEYFTQKLYLPGSFAFGGVGDPREYGVDFKYNW